MKTKFILYKIVRSAEQGNHIYYLKEIKPQGAVFSFDKNEAMRTGLLKAIIFCIQHKLIRLPERYI